MLEYFEYTLLIAAAIVVVIIVARIVDYFGENR